MTEVRQALAVNVRWMLQQDIRAVCEIERSACDAPLTRKELERMYRHAGCVGMVAVSNRRVVGYMIYEFTADTIQLHHLAVAPKYWRRGVGAQMMLRLCSKLPYTRRSQIVLQVRETNVAAQLFFRECGFLAVNVLREHYSDTQEDAYTMCYH